MPRYVFELTATDGEDDKSAYLVEFPDILAARREAQSAAFAWIAYAENNGVPIELHQQFNIYDEGAELVAVVPFFPNSTLRLLSLSGHGFGVEGGSWEENRDLQCARGLPAS